MDAQTAQCRRPRIGALTGDAVCAIEFDRVTLAHSRRTVLCEIGAAIRAGEFIGVFGPNGAGKTTFLRAILGLLPPLSGEIRVFGERPERRNRALGYLPQQRSQVDLTIRGWDFVATAWRGERWGVPLWSRSGRRQIDRAIELVDAEALADRRMTELSGGERQRLLLAQAVLGSPRVLLLDEPLISLDPQFQRSVVALVRRIQLEEGVTVLFTAHDPNPLLGAMDRVLYLGNRRAAIGSVGEVITGEVLSRLYGMPIEVLRLEDRIIVVAAHGPVEAEAHRHDV
jgi:zinc/manganese transport system ATP-binding protein